ncbi:hypothetical protein KCV06_g636, partial [Aureobasidium melanogenum]
MNMFRSLWTRQTADADAEILRSHSERRVLDTIDRARIKSKAGGNSTAIDLQYTDIQAADAHTMPAYRNENYSIHRRTPCLGISTVELAAVVGSPVPAIRKSEAYTYDKSRLSGERAQLFRRLNNTERSLRYTLSASKQMRSRLYARAALE